jgi:hypothetical protein
MTIVGGVGVLVRVVVAVACEMGVITTYVGEAITVGVLVMVGSRVLFGSGETKCACVVSPADIV